MIHLIYHLINSVKKRSKNNLCRNFSCLLKRSVFFVEQLFHSNKGHYSQQVDIHVHFMHYFETKTSLTFCENSSDVFRLCLNSKPCMIFLRDHIIWFQSLVLKRESSMLPSARVVLLSRFDAFFTTHNFHIWALQTFKVHIYTIECIIVLTLVEIVLKRMQTSELWRVTEK